MKEFHIRILYILLVVLFLCLSLAGPALAQEGISVWAEVDRTTISTEDILTLTLTVSGGFQQLGEPALPFLGGFTLVGSSRSSQFSMVDNVVTARTIFTYRLQPAGAGTFSIDPIAVLVNGSPYETNPIAVHVTESAAATQSSESGKEETPSEPPEDQQRPVPGELTGQDLFVEADVDNPAPFVGRQIIYRFRFYRAVNLYNQPHLEWPAFTGFWSEGLNPNNVYSQALAGREYRVTEVRQALFPAIIGEAIIQPTALTISGDFFARETVLKSQPAIVDVQPLPAGAPDGFLGAVGRFEIAARAEPDEARVNEPVTLVVWIWGDGNLTTLPDPTEGSDALLADWRVYDPKMTTNVSQDGDTIAGAKLFERLLVPKTDGQLNIPSFAMVFFDPEAEEYHRVETESLTIQVAPGEYSNGTSKQDIAVLATDIRYIKTAPPALQRNRTALLEQPAYWLGWAVPALALVGVWVWDRRRRRMSSDVAYARAQRARRRARKRLAQAGKQAPRSEDAAYATTAQALTDYLADKSNLPSGRLTRDTVRNVLTAQTVPDEVIERLLNCLDWADSGRFAPVGAGRDSNELVTEAEAIVAELERVIKTA